MKPRVLIVEDEPGLRMGLADGLRSEGFEVEERADGLSGWARADAGGLDAVVLDLMLPGIDGFEVLRRLRAARRAVPVLVLSARGEDEDRIHGFEYGADDYVVKPAPLREIVLRLRAILRRTSSAPPPPEVVRFGAVEADFAAYSLTRAGKRHGLNRMEAVLLRFFLAHAGEPLDRNRLLVEVWGQQRPASASRTVDTHVFRLRQKIEDDPERPRHLHTLRGVGYRFDL